MKNPRMTVRARGVAMVSAAALLHFVPQIAEAQQLPDPAEHVDAQALATLAQQLVRIRSDYDEGVLANHREMAAFLARLFREELGMEVHVVEPTPNYPTVIGRLRGSTGRPALGMIAHYNTVAVGDTSKWERDPFGGEIRDGVLYGLGAADQKMPIAATIEAVRAIKKAGIQLDGDLVLLMIPGEGAQVHSLPHIVRDQPELLKADWYLDTEGGSDILQVSGGWIWVKITVQGITGHTAGTRAGGGGRPVNAIYRLARILTELEDVDRWLRYERHPLFQLPLYGGKPVVEVGKIEGGYKVNQVPDHAEAQVDIRMFPGQTPESVLADIRAVFARLKAGDPELNADVMIMTQQWVPMKYWETLKDDDPLIKAIRDVAPPLLGRTPEWRGGIGGGRPDIWATGATYVSFGGGGGGGNAHSPNEFASIEGGVTRSKLYSRLIVRMLAANARR